MRAVRMKQGIGIKLLGLRETGQRLAAGDAVHRRPIAPQLAEGHVERSGERRVGEEGRARGLPDHLKKKRQAWRELDRYWTEFVIIGGAAFLAPGLVNEGSCHLAIPYIVSLAAGLLCIGFTVGGWIAVI